MATRETVAAAVTRLAVLNVCRAPQFLRVIIRSVQGGQEKEQKTGKHPHFMLLMQVWEIGPRRALPEVLPTFDMHRRSW